MIPGITTKISETIVALSTTIDAKTDLLRVTSTTVTTVLATINPNFGGGFSGVVFLLNDSGNPIRVVTTGNIEVGSDRTIPDNFVNVLVFSKLSGKWYAGPIS